MASYKAVFTRRPAKTSSYWKVVDKTSGKEVFRSTCAQIAGKQVFAQWDALASKEYGQEILNRISEKGLEYTAGVLGVMTKEAEKEPEAINEREEMEEIIPTEKEKEEAEELKEESEEEIEEKLEEGEKEKDEEIAEEEKDIEIIETIEDAAKKLKKLDGKEDAKTEAKEEEILDEIIENAKKLKKDEEIEEKEIGEEELIGGDDVEFETEEHEILDEEPVKLGEKRANMLDLLPKGKKVNETSYFQKAYGDKEYGAEVTKEYKRPSKAKLPYPVLASKQSAVKTAGTPEEPKKYFEKEFGDKQYAKELTAKEYGKKGKYPFPVDAKTKESGNMPFPNKVKEIKKDGLPFPTASLISEKDKQIEVLEKKLAAKMAELEKTKTVVAELSEEEKLRVRAEKSLALYAKQEKAGIITAAQKDVFIDKTMHMDDESFAILAATMSDLVKKAEKLQASEVVATNAKGTAIQRTAGINTPLAASGENELLIGQVGGNFKQAAEKLSGLWTTAAARAEAKTK